MMNIKKRILLVCMAATVVGDFLAAAYEFHSTLCDTDPIHFAQVSGDGKTIVTASYGKELKVWQYNIQDDIWEDVATLENSYSSMQNMFRYSSKFGLHGVIAVNGNGKVIVSGFSDKAIKVWKYNPYGIDDWTFHINGWTFTEPFKEYIFQKRATTAVCFISSLAVSRDGKRVIMGIYDGKLLVYDHHEDDGWIFIKQLEPASQEYHGLVAVSADAQTIITWTSGGELTIFEQGMNGSWSSTMVDLEGIKKEESLNSSAIDHFNFLRSVAVSVQGRTIVAACDSIYIIQQQLNHQWIVTQELKPHKRHVNLITVSGDGSLLVGGSGDCSVKVCEKDEEWEFVQEFFDDGKNIKIQSVSCNDTGSIVAVLKKNGIVQIYHDDVRAHLWIRL